MCTSIFVSIDYGWSHIFTTGIDDNIIIFIGVTASNSSLLGWIQSGSCTSDLILLQQGEYKYNNNALQLDLNTDRGGGSSSGGTLESDIKNNGGGIRL